MQYHDILNLMPDEYHQTLEKLQKFISSDDEIADILGSDKPEDANKKLLNCLIQKMKKREEMLDFCVQLEHIIASHDLKMIISEIKTGTMNTKFFVCN